MQACMFYLITVKESFERNSFERILWNSIKVIEDVKEYICVILIIFLWLTNLEWYWLEYKEKNFTLMYLNIYEL